jgi:sugar lactone lactonase YvrE
MYGDSRRRRGQDRRWLRVSELRANMAYQVDVVLDTRADVAESPSWDVAHDALAWVDIYEGSVHLLEPSTGRDCTIDVGQPAGAIAPAEGGWLILALRDGFWLLDPETRELVRVAMIRERATDALMNDGKCDLEGRFVAGSTTISETPGAGTLYRLNPDHTVEVALRGVTLSNGLDWSPDGRVMYYVDSALHRIDTFRYDHDGHPRGRHPLVEIPRTAGMPDGLTVDADGHIWVALWGGSALRRYSPDGMLEEEVSLPVSQVTSCAFGGSDWGELFITSASWGLGADRLREEPHAGAIFAMRPGVGGLPTRQFRGEPR